MSSRLSIKSPLRIVNAVTQRGFARIAKEKYLEISRFSKIDILDAANPTKMKNRNRTDNPKLGKSLDHRSNDNIPLTAEEECVTQAHGAVISEHFNELLNSSKFVNVFKGFPRASDLIDIEKCKVNPEVTHVSALWTARPLKPFIKAVLEKMGEEKANEMAKKFTNDINKELNNRVSIFRTYIMKRMLFKRVPSLQFAPVDNVFGLTKASPSAQSLNLTSLDGSYGREPKEEVYEASQFEQFVKDGDKSGGLFHESQLKGTSQKRAKSQLKYHSE